jgi:hypothetical protein
LPEWKWWEELLLSKYLACFEKANMPTYYGTTAMAEKVVID